MRLFVLVRHGQSELNVTRRVNGDPAVPVGADRAGRGRGGAALARPARRARARPLRPHPLRPHASRRPRSRSTDATCPSRSSRCSTTSTSASSRAERSTTTAPGSAEHSRADAFPGGESLDDGGAPLRRRVRAAARAREQRILVVCHEIPVRYAVNAAAGSDELDGPAHEIGNCVPHLFDEDGLARAVARMRPLARVEG